MIRHLGKVCSCFLCFVCYVFKFLDTLASASEATWKVSTDDISNLKHGLVSIFNDSFTKQLQETLQVRYH